SLNIDATKNLINYLIDHGVSGIFPLGSNGEFHVVEHNEKIEFVNAVVKIVNHRVPVYAGSGTCSTREAIELSKAFETAGADVLSVITPYFIKPTDEELYNHYKSIAESVSIPVMLYNIPKSTGCNISASVVEKLAHEVPNIQGIKDSSGDMENLKSYIKAADGTSLKVMVGSDSKISEAFALGATGAVAGTSNVIVDTVVPLWNALKAGNKEKAKKLQKDIDVLRGVLKLGTVPSMIKRSIELAEIAEVGPARKPVADSTPAQDEKIREMLDYYKLNK
ncbi:MAG: dihydrodipicolinate synthase family protein, partial [Erysipelotrichaceae bacterium]|nr:dihydrodipicolinate synthase family protein [Erysipelotrichaceae bacterium]